jgi:hypothetical protein
MTRGAQRRTPILKKRTASLLARDPEKWEPVFGKDHAQNENLERDDDSRKNHHALSALLSLSQKRKGCPTGFAQVRRQSITRDGSIITNGEPVCLVCLSVHHKNIGMFVTHDLKAHAFLPPVSIETHIESVDASR